MDSDGQKCPKWDIQSGYMTVTEFAVMMRVSPKTILRAIRRGKINAVNVGNATKKWYRIPRSEVDRIALFDLQELIEKIVEERGK